MKFLLIITMCSNIYQNCMPPVQVEKVFDSHYECAYQGYSLSAEMIKGLGEKQVNRDKIYFNFSCKEIGSL